MIDYNLYTPDAIAGLTKKPIEEVLGNNVMERLDKIFYNYEYYSGKQHKGEMGELVRGIDMERPDGLDYDPAQFETNYYKAFIKRKARWQMAGQHGIEVKPKSESNEDVQRAQDYEELIYRLWKDNKIDSIKTELARHRLVGGSIHFKISFNARTGKLHWVRHLAYEVFPIYSDDGFKTVIGCDIIRAIEGEKQETLYHAQHFRMNDEHTNCSFEDVVYDEKLNVVKTIQEEAWLDIDFVPVVSIHVDSSDEYMDDLEDMQTLTTQLNKMLEDAQDSLAFEMFGITVVSNAKEGTAQQMQIAPGAVVEIQANQEGMRADMKTLENSFQWKEAFKDQYNRVKSALHELSGLPQIVPQELNFGGMNDRALQVLYQDIIQETQEHWLLWDIGLEELFNKSIKYLQARQHMPKFAYDRKKVMADRDIDSLETKVNFVLPLPDDREQLIDLLGKEVEYGFESHKGAMKRAGVVDVAKKQTEINEEREIAISIESPYNDAYEPIVDDGTSIDVNSSEH